MVRFERATGWVAWYWDVQAVRATRQVLIERQLKMRSFLRPTRSETREPTVAPPRQAT